MPLSLFYALSFRCVYVKGAACISTIGLSIDNEHCACWFVVCLIIMLTRLPNPRKLHMQHNVFVYCCVLFSKSLQTLLSLFPHLLIAYAYFYNCKIYSSLFLDLQEIFFSQIFCFFKGYRIY